MSDALGHVGSARLSGRQWVILALVLVADVLDMMDSTICNIAAPSIVANIGGGEALIKWLGSAYALAMGALIVLGGRLGDRYGRNRLFRIGVAGFTLASIWCGVSVSPAMIIFGRVFQGGFGALLLPQGLSILMASFSREQFPTAMSAFGPTLGLAGILGPILAGALISLNVLGLGWRPVFLINIVLGIACFVVACRILPQDKTNRNEVLDNWGTILLSLAAFLLFYGLIEGPTSGWAFPCLAAIGLGVLFAIAFVLRQRKAAAPLIKPNLFRNRGFSSGLVIGLFFFAAVNGFSYVLALYLQQVLGMKALGASLSMIPLLLGIIISSSLGRPLIEAWGRRLVLFGLILTAIGGLALLTIAALTNAPLSTWELAVPLVVLGLGMGACFGSIFDIAIGNIEPEEAGSASGSLSAVQQFANALGSAVVTSVYFSFLGSSQGSKGFTVTVALMVALVVFSVALVPLLPRRALQESA